MDKVNIITDNTTLKKFCKKCINEKVLAIDTEFIRENTYYPILSLIQIASDSFSAIIDPLSDIDLQPFWEILSNKKILKVFHAGRQDIEIFYNLTGKIPTPIYDTQIAAMFCGLGDQVSYDGLVNKFLGLTISKESQFSNWQGGGQNAISVATSLSLNLLYQNTTTTWQTTLDAGYGLMLQGKNGIWYKNDDRIFLATQLGKKASENWNYSLYFSPQTQFQPGYYSEFDTIPISDFFAPGYVVASFGFEYKPDNKLSVFLGPLSSKNTFVLNQDLANIGAYGVEPGVYDYVEGKYIKEGKKIRSETGGFIRVSFYEPRVMKNISLDSRLELFANYLYKRGNIDVNFENQINLKVNEYISTNLILHLIYFYSFHLKYNFYHLLLKLNF